MPQWAKIYRRIGENAALAEMAEANPLAALLFTWSIAAANVYGILPADPRAYRARVAPAMMVDPKAISAAIEAQEKAGLLIRYQGANGSGELEDLLYICNYNRYQDINWFRIKASEYTLPDGWHMPDVLQVAIDNETMKKAHKQWGSYGVEAIAAPKPPSKGTPAKAGEPRHPSNGGGADTPDTPDTRHQTPDNDKGNGNDSALPAEAAASPAPKSAKSRPETPEQIAIREAWEAHDLGPLPGGKLKEYSGLMKFVQEYGIPLLRDWTAHVRAFRPPPLPEGAKPWPWFCGRFRDAMKNSWKWQDKPRASPGRGPVPISDHSDVELLEDGSVKF